MSEAFFSKFPAAHRAAMANALPGSTVTTDHLGTTVTGPRTFEPSPALSDRSPANIVSPSSPFSNIFFSTMREPEKKLVDTRTVLISVDGACAGNGTPSARAGVGIFFGPNSPHNVSEAISGPQTNQRAEILAATKALRKASNLLEDVISVSKIVLLCDSKYVVGAMTEWVFAWKENGWKNAKGGQVENKADFQELDAAIEKLEEDGLDVKFWLVGRENNAQADQLAKAACT
ncbi:ribonuclease H-like domain-containing protein [Mycena sp. CBHHK59/15]|nr:ribonuclease H-like domain-containing protein [Mycena sp. CBHHK59/15]